MLKPRKTRKCRAQMTFRPDGAVYYSPNRKKPLVFTEQDVKDATAFRFPRPANVWYGMRALQAHVDRKESQNA